MSVQRIETVIVGAGQAGLATGYHLRRRQRPFVILEAHPRVGDSWRRRWDSLRLFTPARYDALPGLRFPAPDWSFPTAAEFAGYLGDYARHFELPVRTNTPVRRLTRAGDRFLVETDEIGYEADNVVVATGPFREPRIPAFASELDPRIRRLHSAEYRNPGQLGAGDVLVVGAGNTGADLALELSRTHRVLLSGRHPGQLPWRIEGPLSRPLTPVAFFAFRHLLTVRTPAGRRLRPKVLAHGGPLIRVKSADLAAAGVVRMPRTTGVRDGLPEFADGRTADVTTVLWCTGYRPDETWDGVPGLHHVGRTFQYALASSMVQGVGRDAGVVAAHLARAVEGARGIRPARVPGR